MVLAGPKREWLIVLGAVLLGAGLLFFTRGRSWSGGERVSLAITLITSDRHDLACALEQDVMGLSCAFREPERPAVPPAAASELLAPYMTPDRRMLLVPGLFEQPALSARYDREKPTGRARQRLKRFVATCQMELVSKVPQAKVRFGKRGNWDQVSDVWVAKPSGCTVSD